MADKTKEPDFTIAMVTPENGYDADACKRHHADARNAAMGHFIKIGLTATEIDQTEWLWVKLTERNGDKLVGLIANDPVFCNAKFDDRIEFTMDNVFTVQKAE